MGKAKSKKKKIDFTIRHGKINRKLKGDGFCSDLGTPELENHHAMKIEYVDAEGNYTDPQKGRKRARNITQTTLDYCKAYALISEEQHAAGERLYWDCYYGGLVSRAVALLPTGMPRSKTNKFPDFAEGRVDSQRRYARVRDELNRRYIDRQLGITYWKVAYQVCIEGIAVDALEKWTQWPRRSGKKLISLVLDELSSIYEAMYKEQQRKRNRSSQRHQ